MLSIKKVILYKHGVGYFERQGRVQDHCAVELYFKAAEMNDVLKSLTVLDLDGGAIANISYESTKPIEKQLEDIAIRLPERNSLTGLLAQIQGAHVAVEIGSQSIQGVLTGTETVTRREGDAVIETHYVNVLADGSVMRSLDLLEADSVVLLDENLKKDLQHLLEISIAAKKKDLKRLTIFAKGAGSRELLASYVVETPVWKTSYRILLGAEAPLIQGWALVDNTQDEDWQDVHLTLVAGLPVSFSHDLYSPRYKRRPVVEVEEEEAYAPPVLEAPVKEFSALADEMEEDLALAAAGPMAFDEPPSLQASSLERKKSVAAARRRSMPVQTRTVEVGDLFQYAIENTVTVKRNESALVPILQTEFAGKRVAVYNQSVRDKNPMSAVLFENTTGLTLEGGPVTVLEEEEYVGESMLETLKPGEERLIPYSVELGCVISIDHRSDTRDIHAVNISRGNLFLHHYKVKQTIYTIKTKHERGLDLFLEHKFEKGWELVDTPEPVEQTDNYYRFRFDVPAKQELCFTVQEKGQDYQVFDVCQIHTDQLRFWYESRYIDQATLKAIEELLVLAERIAQLEHDIDEQQKEIQEIFKDQERLRKNIQALGGSMGDKTLHGRYVAELAAGEDRLARLRTAIKGMKDDKQQAEQSLAGRLQDLRYDADVEE